MTLSLLNIQDKLWELASDNQLVLTDTQVDSSASVIHAALANKGTFGATRVAHGKGLVITTYAPDDGLLDIIRLHSPVSCPQRKVPRKDWLKGLMLPYRAHRDFTTELKLIHELIRSAIKDGGSWQAKVCGHFAEIEIKDFTGYVINTLTIRKTGYDDAAQTFPAGPGRPAEDLQSTAS